MDLTENIMPAFLLTAVAGLSTGIGSTVAYFIKKPKPIYLAFSLGLSAGVMIYISFVEMLPAAFEAIQDIWAVVIFFAGIALIGLIDISIPQAENPHDYTVLGDDNANAAKQSFMRTGLLTALAIGIHNFPEGLAAFGTALSDMRLGVFTAVAIAIHNIPEGISVSVPIFYATGSGRKAFLYSFLSGLAEPVGACLGFLVLWPFLSEKLLASLLGFVAGIMVYISLDELLPSAHRFGHGHIVILGVVLGMLIMAVSLLLI